MAVNDNSVNIKKGARDRYHHGDLRAALIEAGLAQLAEGNVETLSLRELARRTGVSATAVYRHFPDKQALLHALAAEGAERLGQAQAAAMAAAGGGEAGFAAAGQTYVRFALAHPALFRLMMSAEAADAGFEDGSDAPNSAMRLLKRSIAELAGPDAQAQRTQAAHAWSLVHGMAMLMLDGHLPADEALIATIAGPRFGA
jgi:AcrR family transcriptional regulator